MNCPECGESFGDTCSEYIVHVMNSKCEMKLLFELLDRFCKGCGEKLSPSTMGVRCHRCELQAKLDVSQLKMDLISSIRQGWASRGDWPPKYWKG